MGKYINNYSIGFLIFALGLILMPVTGCNGYWSNCWTGWSKLPPLLIPLGMFIICFKALFKV